MSTQQQSSSPQETLIVKDNSEQNEQFFMISCVQCRQSHRKCDRKLPTCNQCAKRNISCVYNPPKKRQRQVTEKNQQQQLPPSKQVRLDDELTQPNSTTSSSNTDDVSLSSVLDAFFHAINNKGSVSREDLLLSLQNNTAFSRGTITPPPQSTEKDTFDMKVNKALWYAIRAMTLLHSPSREEHDYEFMTDRFYSNVQDQLKLTTADSCLIDTTDVRELSSRFSRVQLREAAEQMYKTAKENILAPDVYPHIANNPKLAQACAHLTHYLIARNENIGETKLLLSAVKVFLDCSQGLVNVDLSLFVGAEKERMEKLQKAVTVLFSSFYAAKMLLFLNQYPHTGPLQFDQIEKMIEALSKSKESKLKLNNHICTSFPSAVILKLKQIVKEEIGLQRVAKFMEVADILASDIGWIEPNDSNGVTGWRIGVYCLQYHLIMAEIRHNQEVEAKKILKQYQLDIANKICRLSLQNISVILLAGAYLSRVFISIADTHSEHTLELLVTSDYTVPILADMLAFLQADVYILDTIFEKYGLNEVEQKSKDLKQRIASVTAKMQRLTQPQVPLDSSKLVTPSQLFTHHGVTTPTTNLIAPPTTTDSQVLTPDFQQQHYQSPSQFLHGPALFEAAFQTQPMFEPPTTELTEEMLFADFLNSVGSEDFLHL